jgi:hypothetical protein
VSFTSAQFPIPQLPYYLAKKLQLKILSSSSNDNISVSANGAAKSMNSSTAANATDTAVDTVVIAKHKKIINELKAVPTYILVSDRKSDVHSTNTTVESPWQLRIAIQNYRAATLTFYGSTHQLLAPVIVKVSKSLPSTVTMNVLHAH